jgi:hypothetical protein
MHVNRATTKDRGIGPKGMFGLCPQAVLPKLASQFFGLRFGCQWVIKILARISEGDIM